ncbi:hypothetical protein APA_4900 [Pseudanabaena sp. lw0831]|uniref:hypothetical protein n=1 Tax=Pseudanabaena sp. lw0831 TaxID=1357935 RepID=UPI00191604BB|nr:hypothetical protein [Pseudanabaena sp. lw0831]GBO56565.1 hypothetical protein APA_4900 [Pseudanabaena sp. lw0831]
MAIAYSPYLYYSSSTFTAVFEQLNKKTRDRPITDLTQNAIAKSFPYPKHDRTIISQKMRSPNHSPKTRSP